MSFPGKVVAITGANGGIGRVLCRYFGEAGATIAAFDKKDQVMSFAGELGKEGIKAVGDELTLAAIIDGRVEGERGVATARIAIRDPKDGSIVANEVWSVRRGGTKALVKVLVKTFWLKMGPAMEDLTGVEINQPRARRARRSHS